MERWKVEGEKSLLQKLLDSTYNEPENWMSLFFEKYMKWMCSYYGLLSYDMFSWINWGNVKFWIMNAQTEVKLWLESIINSLFCRYNIWIPYWRQCHNFDFRTRVRILGRKLGQKSSEFSSLLFTVTLDFTRIPPWAKVVWNWFVM